jgi:hypothetical protein
MASFQNKLESIESPTIVKTPTQAPQRAWRGSGGRRPCPPHMITSRRAHCSNYELIMVIRKPYKANWSRIDINQLHTSLIATQRASSMDCRNDVWQRGKRPEQRRRFEGETCGCRQQGNEYMLNRSSHNDYILRRSSAGLKPSYATVRSGAYARSGFTRTQLPSLFDRTKCSRHMIWSFRERIWGMKCTIQRKLFSLYYFIYLFIENMSVLCIGRKDGVYMSGTMIAIVGHVEMKTCTRHHDNKLVLRVATLCAPQ